MERPPMHRDSTESWVSVAWRPGRAAQTGGLCNRGTGDASGLTGGAGSGSCQRGRKGRVSRKPSAKVEGQPPVKETAPRPQRGCLVCSCVKW